MKPGYYRHLSASIPLYRGELHVLVGHDLAATCRAAGIDDGHVGGQLPLCLFEALTFCADKDGGRGYFALLRPGATLNTLAHEGLHLTNKILRDRGVALDYDNDEPHAYLLGWVVEQLQAALAAPPSKSISLP